MAAKAGHWRRALGRLRASPAAYTHIDAAGLAAINESTALSLFPRVIRPVE